ncbi:MAG: DUF1611 domain-containing protein [Planctomycetota bacterium]
MPRKMILLTMGHTEPRRAKTAAGLLRFCPEECVAVLDPDSVGKNISDLLGVGGDTPIVASLEEVPQADTFVLGIATPGGKIPVSWRPLILQAIERKMNILNGLHDFISEDEEFVAAAKAHEVLIHDVRKNNFKEIAKRPGFREGCLRVHTVGHDCSVGKMLASVELTRGLQQRNIDAQFVATGQTGIMVAGSGLPLDCLAADFVSGGAEQLVIQNESHDILMIEGQGSLVHPAYSQVTLGLLAGCQPHALIMVFEAGRENVAGMEHIPLMGLAEQRELFEKMGSLYQPCETIGVAMNGRKVSPSVANEIAEKVSLELELPVCDIVRDGPDKLLDAIEDFRQKLST